MIAICCGRNLQCLVGNVPGNLLPVALIVVARAAPAILPALSDMMSVRQTVRRREPSGSNPRSSRGQITR